MPGSKAAERVRAVLEVAARIVDARDPLGQEARRSLEATSGLSPEGVELALTDHTETAIDGADMERLLTWAGDAPRCHVVLSSNVCTAAVRAVALAVASAPDVRIRPSRRDPGLAPLLARELASHPSFHENDGTIMQVNAIEARPGDVVHAYGADATLGDIERALAGGVLFRGHGTGFGLVFVSPRADLDDAAGAMADDVVAFDQRGCLSPRIALVAGDPGRGRAFASRLSSALTARAARVPRGPLDAATAAADASFGRLADAMGEAFGERDHLVAFFGDLAVPPLPPATRAVSVLSVADAASGQRAIAPYRAFLTTIGGDLDDDAARSLAALGGVRFTRIGQMQRPPLDGPVDPR